MSIPRRSEIGVAIVTALAFVAAPAHADDDSLAPYRDRFRQGMEKYRSGAMAEAIRIWSAIYEEIGPQRGYRLSFNLARAYEANFETTRAAERYQSFLDEVAVRRQAGEAIDPLVEREAAEAQGRLDQLDASNGRIRVASGGRTVLTQVDGADPRLGSFTTYVAPGDHVVIFAPGAPDQERRVVTAKAGELVDVSPSPEAVSQPQTMAPPTPTIAPPPAPRHYETVHPFPPVVLYLSAGVALASVVVPVVTYGQASSLFNQYDTTANLQVKQSVTPAYYSARTTAYATLAIPIALTAVTGTLTVLYFTGAKRNEVSLGAGPEPGGGRVFLRTSF